ncbi:unnamed protein product [Cyprideis torosa]|uniref:Uncharacterized protein n=1 Tax=Cyprideis torosa TaxID=163714 RepID=A0A7R8W3S4_9CRUS|nr:unnamed protein product [Cyprideis torosa]CAG0883199.1 unnamed protein product [Cyprideis torosa]
MHCKAPCGGPTEAPCGGPTEAPCGGPTEAPCGGPTEAPCGGPTRFLAFKDLTRVQYRREDGKWESRREEEEEGSLIYVGIAFCRCFVSLLRLRRPEKHTHVSCDIVDTLGIHVSCGYCGYTGDSRALWIHWGFYRQNNGNFSATHMRFSRPVDRIFMIQQDLHGFHVLFGDGVKQSVSGLHLMLQKKLDHLQVFVVDGHQQCRSPQGIHAVHVHLGRILRLTLSPSAAGSFEWTTGWFFPLGLVAGRSDHGQKSNTRDCVKCEERSSTLRFTGVCLMRSRLPSNTGDVPSFDGQEESFLFEGQLAHLLNLQISTDAKFSNRCGAQNLSSMVGLTFSSSPGRRGRKAILNGHMFTRHRPGTPPKPTQWQCCRRPCPARLKIQPDEKTFALDGEHDHLPDFGACKAQVVLANVRKRARENIEVSASRVTQQALGRVDSETAAALPSEASVKRAAKRARRENVPPLPKTITDLAVLPPQYRNIEGENWILHDSGPDEEWFIIFCKRRTVRKMKQSWQSYLLSTEILKEKIGFCMTVDRTRNGS